MLAATAYRSGIPHSGGRRWQRRESIESTHHCPKLGKTNHLKSIERAITANCSISRAAPWRPSGRRCRNLGEPVGRSREHQSLHSTNLRHVCWLKKSAIATLPVIVPKNREIACWSSRIAANLFCISSEGGSRVASSHVSSYIGITLSSRRRA